MLYILIIILLVCLIYGISIIFRKKQSIESFTSQEPIDIVYTYVNGNDPNFISTRKYVSKKYYDPNTHTYDSNILGRFNDRDELKYSLRSVDYYLNFYRNIYIVTNGTLPKWLNINHPRIKTIKHSDIPVLKDYLPTYNSHAIEANLHRIPGLSEKFLYFNDDILISKKIDISDFIKDGKIIIHSDNTLSYKGNKDTKKNGFDNAWSNSNKYLDYNYKSEKRYVYQHIPLLIDKNIINNLWNELPNELLQTTKNKFRSINDYNIFQGLHTFTLYYNNFFSYPEYKISYYLSSNNIHRFILSNFNKSKYKFICINDENDKDIEKTDLAYKNLLEEMYPVKSQFEI
jgi:hypothetical protein